MFNLVGDNVRLLRKERGMSVNKLSKISGVSLGFISDIENNKTNPSIPTLEKIANALDVKVELFFKENLDETIGRKLTYEKLKEWDDNDIKETKAPYISSSSLKGSLKNKLKETELFKTGEFTTPQAAMKFILEQPSIMGYGGFDTSKMSDQDIIDFANELLNIIKMLGPKYNK
ncbi:helix-turn-helix domain-containing protein [Clostridium botulinum]|uniref:helix-turn-helix domain-containing protein n=1 Tax=Clostridium botulinum TaxID=1491 RepID=UPI003DA3532A